MNPYKTQSIQIAQDFKIRNITSNEIKIWISKILEKPENKEPWMEMLLSACDFSDADILSALHAIPFDHPNDDTWEKMLRKPLTPKTD